MTLRLPAAAGSLLPLTAALSLALAGNRSLGLSASHLEDPILLAEVRETASQGPQCCPEIPVLAATFCLAYGEPVAFTPGAPFATAFTASVGLGCDVQFPIGRTAFVDYDASNSAGFNALVLKVTDGVDDELMWTCHGGIDASGSLVVPAGCAGGPESGRLDGLHRPPDLFGSTVGFIRLLVNKIGVSEINRIDYDVTWQFWSGAPLADGGGQRSDVDDFLMYANPLQDQTTVPAGAGSINVTIFYSTQIHPATFRATLNGRPFDGFTPLAGTRESVLVPLDAGRHVLALEVDGTRADGRTATDRDRLTFVVR